MSEAIVHGTPNGYRKNKCRCTACKAALTEYHRRWREAHPEYRTERIRQPSAHGTVRRYSAYKCRCDECRDVWNEYQRLWCEDNPERAEYAREWQRSWRQENPEAAAEKSRRWREANPEKVAARIKRWQKANPEKVAEYSRLESHRRRARMRDAFIEDVPRLEIFERDEWQCLIPGCLHPEVPASLDVPRHHPLLATIDHVIPLSKGGLHERTNLACAHFVCNSVKQDRIEGIA